VNYIDGIAISNYRSFGSDIQKIGPFSKLNIIIGKNNSGKSNILKFLMEYYPNLIKILDLKYIKKPPSLEFKHEYDIHLGLSKANISLGAGFHFRNEENINNYFNLLESRGVSLHSVNVITLIFHHLLENDIEMLWCSGPQKLDN